MTIETALDTAGIPRKEMEILLASLLQCDRAWIFAHEKNNLSDIDEKKIQEWIALRKTGEPIAYITRTKEFYGRMFHVNNHTLIPRPATEGVVESALTLLRTGKTHTFEVDAGIIAFAHVFGSIQDVTTIVDIGTGSGCIAITLKLERPDLKIIATDISDDALKIAKENAQQLKAEVTFLKGDALEPIQNLTEPFLLVSNPPYIPSERTIMKEVADFEPFTALFAGSDGLEVIRVILEQAKRHPFCRGLILECEKEQKSAIEALL